MQKLEERQNALTTLRPDTYPEMKTHLLTKYVDDVLAAMKRFQAEVRWSPVEGAMVKDPNIPPDLSEEELDCHTLEEYAKAASSQIQCLNFTWDAPAKI